MPQTINIQPHGKDALKLRMNGKIDTSYEPEISELFCRWLRPGDHVIDVGANIGWFTCLAKSLIGEAGLVYAFEPGPENLKTLRENVELNEYKNVIFNGAPLSDVSRTQKFYLNPHGHGGHALWEMKDGIAVDVKTETLDEQSFPEHIRILKIDTEGHEQRILAGAHKLLQSPSAPDFIFAEYHGQGLAAAGDTEHSLRIYMSNHGYRCFLLPPHSYLPMAISARVAVHSDYAINYLFVRETHFAEMPQFIMLGTFEPKEEA